jgi:hypothetical protein
MKSNAESLLVLLIWLPLAVSAKSIESLTLDERQVVTVSVSTNRVTTLTFPGPIDAIDVSGVSVDPKIPAAFQMAHTKGSAFLSLRALEAAGNGNINIRWQGATYVFELREDQTPVLCLNLRAAPVTPSVLPAPRLSAAKALALLDKAKAFPLLKSQHPGVVRGVEVRTFGASTEMVSDAGDYEIGIEEVYRFQEEDSLVFKIVIRNKTDKPLEFDPGSLALRVGARRYPLSVSDASGNVDPKSESKVYFAVTGTPDGGRNELSLKNQFSVELTRRQRPANLPAPEEPVEPETGQ